MTRQSFTLCIALLLLAMAGSWAMYLLGIDQGAAWQRETAVLAAELAHAPAPSTWLAEFEALDAAAKKARPDLDDRERQWRVLLIMQAAHRYLVDSRLALSVAIVESGLRQDAVSHKGAVGVMQLMPSVAASYGANPHDLAENIDVGVRYLASLLERYKDTALALSAYNAGPSKVRNSVPRIRATRNYVKKVSSVHRGMR